MNIGSGGPVIVQKISGSRSTASVERVWPEGYWRGFAWERSRPRTNGGTKLRVRFAHVDRLVRMAPQSGAASRGLASQFAVKTAPTRDGGRSATVRGAVLFGWGCKAALWQGIALCPARLFVGAVSTANAVAARPLARPASCGKRWGQSRSAALCRSGACSDGSPQVRLTLRPRITAGRSAISAAQRCRCL